MLSELLAKTPIVRGEGASTGSGATPSTGGGGFDFVDENVDPELAMTLKLSLETEEAERRARAGSGEAATPGAGSNTAAANSAGFNDVNMDEDPELAEALRQSMLENVPQNQTQDTPMAEDDDDDELARAMALSQQTAEADRANDEKTPLLAAQQKEPENPKPEETTEDSEYLSSLLLSLPGVDPNDPEVQAMLEQMKKEGGQ